MPTTKYIWDEENDSLLGETDENGMPTAVYTMLPERFGRLISEKRDEETRYHHYDALGSTRQLTDESGHVTDTFTFDGWGNIVSRTGTSETPFQWVGEWGYYFDSELGVYQVRRRPLKPAISRWTSGDPLQQDALNPFMYVLNRALTLVDPSGLLACWSCTFTPGFLTIGTPKEFVLIGRRRVPFNPTKPPAAGTLCECDWPLRENCTLTCTLIFKFPKKTAATPPVGFETFTTENPGGPFPPPVPGGKWPFTTGGSIRTLPGAAAPECSCLAPLTIVPGPGVTLCPPAGTTRTRWT